MGILCVGDLNFSFCLLLEHYINMLRPKLQNLNLLLLHLKHSVTIPETKSLLCTCSWTLHTISYIRHFVHKWNLMGAIGKTHIFKIQNTLGNWKHLEHTPENTYLQNWSPISQPQIGFCWAIVRTLQAWRQGEQEVEVEEEEDKERERGVGHGRRGYARNNISDDIGATLVDHVINHGLTMREAVHPHLSWFTVASNIRTFRLENRYIFNSPLQTVSTVFTVLYHITLLYHMYCIASWLVFLL